MDRDGNATDRFTRRAKDYARSRPDYPAALLDVFRLDLGLKPAHNVADLGSGTGILSEMFLENGNAVFGVEPNRDMREIAEARLSRYGRFHSAQGSAEATGLGEASVDFVVAGQAFHWFDPEKIRKEARRILVPSGWGVWIWNNRLTRRTGFLRGYEALLQTWGIDYASVSEAYEDPGAMATVMGPQYETRTLPNHQDLDRDGLRARVSSASYMPGPDDARSGAMLAELDRLFAEYAREGTVRIEYETKVYYGHVAG